MTDPSFVSIIIIFLNEEEFIDEAIRSVMAQSYQKWELLLVDDGSTDKSTGIAADYAQNYPERVRYLEHAGHQNRGTSASRQLGFDRSKGDYIALLDADDIWLDHKLAEQVQILNDHPEAGMLYGNSLYWHSWTGLDSDKRLDFYPELGAADDIIFYPPSLLPLYLLGKEAVPCTSSVMVRRRVVDKVDGFEESFPGMYDDQVFYAKVCINTPVYVANTSWDCYRQHASSICATAEDNNEYFNARHRFLDWLSSYLANQGVEDDDVWMALGQASWLNDGDSSWLSISFNQRRRLRQFKKWILIAESVLLPVNFRRWFWKKRNNN